MGRYSQPLAPQLVEFAGVRAGQRVVDVGCGPGALTSELVARLGADSVTAADPSKPFVQAARERHPGVEVALAPAEDLPFGDDAFDAALAQLVVHFMKDPIAGLAEMRRVTRAGGVVAASVWDHARARSRCASSTRRSTSGGSRSRSASGRRARSSRAWTPTRPRGCASGAEPSSGTDRSLSPPGPGRHGAAPDAHRAGPTRRPAPRG